MAIDLIPKLPWYLMIFFLIIGFILRRVGRFVGWLLAALWPESMISIEVGVENDENVPALASGGKVDTSLDALV
jgi:hypothetical protein